MVKYKSIWSLWGCATLVALVSAAVLNKNGVNINASYHDLITTLFLIFSVLSWYKIASYNSHIIRMCILCAQFISLFFFIAFSGTLCSYALAEFTNGFTDNKIVAIDKFIGISWVTLYNFESSSIILSAMARYCYSTIL